MSLSTSYEALDSPEHPQSGHLAARVEAFAWRYRKIIWIFIVAFYLLSCNALWRPGPDSALYLSIARSIARGEGYVYLGEAHRLAYPGLPYLVAGAMRVAGENAEALVLGGMLAMGLASLWLWNRLFSLMVSPGAAMIVTAITAVNFVTFRLAFEILTDMPFLIGTAMAILGAVLSGIAPAQPLSSEARTPSTRERKIGWVLLPAGLMICAVMRPTFYLLAACILVAGLIAAFRARRASVTIALVTLAGLIASILLIVTAADPRRASIGSDIYEQAVSWHFKYAFADITVPLSNAWMIISPELPTAYFGFSWSELGDPIIVCVLLAAAGWVLRRWPLGLLWIGGTLLMQVIVEPVPRYFVPIVPLLALAWWEAARRISGGLSARSAKAIILAALLLMTPNFFRSMGQVWFEQYRRPFLTYYHQGNYLAINEMAELIRQNVPADAVIITPEKTDRIFTYLADRWSISPTEPIPERLREKEVWVVFAREYPRWRELLKPLIVLGPKVDMTSAKYRSGGQLVLRKATWAKAPAITPQK